MAEVTYAPTEDLDLIRSTTRQFLEEKADLGVVRRVMMTDDGHDRGLWSGFSEMGWTGLLVPENYGGAGLGYLELSVVLDEMGRLVTPGPFFASAVVATTAMIELGSTDQQERWLPAMASGEKVATLAVFEKARDWGLEHLRTSAVEEGGVWKLSGTKRYVLDGHVADLLFVVAKVGDGLGVFVVDADSPGLTVSQVPVLDPTRRQAVVELDHVVAAARLQGGSSGLARVLRLGSVALACEQVGGAQRVLESTVAYARTRHQFGRPIGSFQAVKHRCAEMLMKVEHAKSVAYHAARVTDDLDELDIASPLAASVSSEAYLWAAGESIQIHGGIGFTWEHEAHLYLKRAKSASLLLGDPRFHRSLLAEALSL